MTNKTSISPVKKGFGPYLGAWLNYTGQYVGGVLLILNLANLPNDVAPMGRTNADCPSNSRRRCTSRRDSHLPLNDLSRDSLGRHDWRRCLSLSRLGIQSQTYQPLGRCHHTLGI